MDNLPRRTFCHEFADITGYTVLPSSLGAGQFEKIV